MPAVVERFGFVFEHRLPQLRWPPHRDSQFSGVGGPGVGVHQGPVGDGQKVGFLAGGQFDLFVEVTDLAGELGIVAGSSLELLDLQYRHGWGSFPGSSVAGDSPSSACRNLVIGRYALMMA